MNKTVQKKIKANRLLNIIWGLVTAFFLVLAFFYVFQNEQRGMTSQVIETAEYISTKVDKLIDKVTQAIYSTGIREITIKDCKKTLLPKLQHIVLNVPEIAGLTVLKNATPPVLCSTMPHNDRFAKIAEDTRPLRLLGPVSLEDIDKPVFIFQQKLGTFYVNIDILMSDISRWFVTKVPFISSIALYDTAHHQTLLKVSRDTTSTTGWKTQKPQQTGINNSLKGKTQKSSVRNELIRINGIEVRIDIDEKMLKYLAIRNAFLSDLLILFIALGIYIFLRRLLHQHYSLHQALLNSLRHNEFFPVYQPIMDRRTNLPCGAEILLRWQSTEDEVIMPDSFVDYAEKTGLIVPITLALVKTVFSESASFLHAHPHFHLAINLSAAHFIDRNFCRLLLNLCKKNGIPPQQIILEVTERALLQHDVTIINKMSELREDGFSIAIDDFGTGNSNISYLQHFPFNYLKIDRMFVSVIGSGAVTETLSLSIIEMANRLGVAIIAEGVETYEQVEVLESHGAMLMQGWYFSKALSFKELQQFIQRNQP